jgi:hypothetical protein
MLEAFSTPRDRNRAFILLGASAVLAAAAAAVGIDDNPPGLLLAFLSGCALVVAFVHPWKTSKQFVRLIYASLLVFVVSVVLHNVFEGVASRVGVSGLAQGLLGWAGGAFFLIATMVCPAVLVVGLVGAVVMSIRKSDPQQDAPAA